MRLTWQTTSDEAAVDQSGINMYDGWAVHASQIIRVIGEVFERSKSVGPDDGDNDRSKGEQW